MKDGTEKTRRVKAESARETALRNAVGYARVSTEGQASSGISLEAQRAAIERFAESLGYHLIEIFEEAASGAKESSFHRREALQRALDLASRNDADLIVWDWDRLSRYSGFDAQISRRFPDRSRIICAKEGEDRLRAASDAAFAHGEVVAKENSRRTREGMALRAAEGVVFGNPNILLAQPLGSAAYSDKAGELARQVADVIRDVAEPFKMSHEKVAQLLNEKGLRTLHKKEWTASRVRGPLKRAREILRKEIDEAYAQDPLYGAF